MKKRKFRYGPYLVAVLMVVNGFYSMVAGLMEVFHLDRYLAGELDLVRGHLEAAPTPRFGSIAEALLGLIFVILGKGLAERRQRSRNVATVALLLNIAKQLFMGESYDDWILSATVLLLLGIFRTEYTRRSERHRWSFAEVIAVISMVFALTYGIGGVYLLRNEFSGIETWTDAVNTLVALTACRLRDEHDGNSFRIVVRIENEENVAKLCGLGVDEIISPSTLGGRLMARRALGAADDAANG